MTADEHPMIEDASAWKGADFKRKRAWVHHLTPAMIAEVETALAAVKAKGTPFREVTRKDFPLDRTAGLLAKAYRDLNEGQGFTVVAGFPVERYDYDDNLLAYSGMASHFGKIVVQNYEGDFAVDVIDKGIPYDHRSRGYSSNKLLPFHTDGADYAGLLCLETAASGGLSLISSAPEVYNEILRTRPEYMETLRRGFYHHRRGQHDAGEPPLSPEAIPVFDFHNGLLHCCYNRNPIVWAEKEGAKLSDHEVAVLDYFDSITARADMQLPMDLQKGDMQFINNYVILHSRTEYQDDADHRRHLVRLWLDDPDGQRNGMSLLDLYVPKASRFQKAS